MLGRYAISQAPIGGQASRLFLFSLTEGMTSLDTNTVNSTFSVAFNEGSRTTDTSTTQTLYHLTQNEGNTLADAESISRLYEFTKNEGLGASERLTVYGWVHVPDTQDPNWKPVIT